MTFASYVIPASQLGVARDKTAEILKDPLAITEKPPAGFRADLFPDGKWRGRKGVFDLRIIPDGL